MPLLQHTPDSPSYDQVPTSPYAMYILGPCLRLHTGCGWSCMRLCELRRWPEVCQFHSGKCSGSFNTGVALTRPLQDHSEKVK